MNRKQNNRTNFSHLAEQKALLIALSDDLALPLLQIKTSLELLEHQKYSTKIVAEQAKVMTLSVDIGLQLAEAYRLVLQSDKLQSLPLEPVAIGSILDEIAHELGSYASEYDTKLQVDIQGKLTPVLAHKPSLQAALQCLSASLIRAQAAQTQSGKHNIILGAHRADGNIVAAGVFTNIQGLSDSTLRAARALVGHARQPLQSLPAGAASGVLIADMLCSAMWQPLRAAAHKNMSGLAVGVPSSKQLQFV
jgi:light-regulated signal transduction histidine kinase (bacteriophytochrome)